MQTEKSRSQSHEKNQCQKTVTQQYCSLNRFKTMDTLNITEKGHCKGKTLNTSQKGGIAKVI